MLRLHRTLGWGGSERETGEAVRENVVQANLAQHTEFRFGLHVEESVQGKSYS